MGKRDERERRGPQSYAAFDPADVDDAKRGYPLADLTAYATVRQLHPRQGQKLEGFLGAVPRWPDYVFGMAEGRFPGDRYGLVEHELYEIEINERGLHSSGSFWGVRTNAKRGLLSILSIRDDPEPTEPFEGNVAFLPVTKVAVRIPEAALLPRVVVTTADHLSSSPKFDVGGRQFAFIENRHLADGVVAAVFANGLGGALPVLHDRFVRIEAEAGVVSLTVNGYRTDVDDLDRLVWAASAVATHLASVGPTVAPPAGYPFYDSSWSSAMERIGNEHGLTRYSPTDFHRALPRSPIPGCSIGALYGTLPGRGQPTWFTWQTQLEGSSRWAGEARRCDAPTPKPTSRSEACSIRRPTCSSRWSMASPTRGGSTAWRATSTRRTSSASSSTRGVMRESASSRGRRQTAVDVRRPRPA